MLELQKTTIEDLEQLFAFQTNKEGIWMAAFTSEDPSDKEAYMQKWTKIIANPSISMQTIRQGAEVVGSVIHFDVMEETNVSYWIDRPCWGKGIATEALQKFVKNAIKRPLYARVAFDNYASQRVLEKAGFVKVGKEKGFANARKKEIEEFVYTLNE